VKTAAENEPTILYDFYGNILSIFDNGEDDKVGSMTIN